MFVALSESIYSFLKYFFLYPLQGVGKKVPLERSFALPSLLSMLSLLHTQWAAGTVVAHSRLHKKAYIHSFYYFSTRMFVWTVDVGFSQNEI